MFAAVKEQQRLRNLLGNAEPTSVVKEQRGVPLLDSSVGHLFQYTGLNLAQQRSRTIKFASVTVFIAVTCFVSFGFVAAVMAVVGLCYWQLQALERMRRKRSIAFEKEYVAFLLSFASSVRTGLDPFTALLGCGQLFPEDSIVRAELQAVEQALALGETEEQAMLAFGKNVRHPDVALLRTAVILARKQGASIADCLMRLGKVTRQRQSFRRKVKAALAMQRLSAIGIALCAFVIAGIQFLTSPKAMIEALHHSTAQVVLGLGLGLMICGVVLLLRMSREKI